MSSYSNVVLHVEAQDHKVKLRPTLVSDFLTDVILQKHYLGVESYELPEKLHLHHCPMLYTIFTEQTLKQKVHVKRKS